MQPIDLTSSSRNAPHRVRWFALYVSLLIVVLMATTFTAAVAQTVGGWTQAGGDAEHRGAVLDGLAPPYREAWSVSVPPGGQDDLVGLSAPVIAGQTVVSVGPDAVIGVDLASGDRRWLVERRPGPAASPAVAELGATTAVIFTEGGDLLVASASATSTPSASAPSSATTSPSGAAPDERPTRSPSPGGSPTRSASPATGGGGSSPSQLAAFDLDTRKSLWDPIDLGATSRTGVTVNGSVAYVGTTDGDVAAVDLRAGKVSWTAELGSDVITAIAVTGDTVIVSVQGDRSQPPGVVALNAEDGQQRWRVDGPTGSVLASAPSTDGHSVFVSFAGASEQVVEAAALADGAPQWSTRISSPVDPAAAPIVTDDAVYLTNILGHSFRFAKDDGSRTWDFALNVTNLRSSAVVSGDAVVVGSSTGMLAAIDTASGHLIWRGDEAGGALRGLLATPDLVIGVRAGSGGGLVAFEADPDGTLLDEPSPTQFDLGLLLAGFLLAAVPIAVLVLLFGRVLGSRSNAAPMGVATAMDDGPADATEEDVP